jgi:hypothetical protein
MWLDLLALTLVGVAAGFGAARGALAGALGLVSLAGGCAAALVAGPRLGPRLAAAAELPAPLGTALAGSLACAGAWVGLGVLGRWLRRIEERRIGLSRRLPDRLGGGVLGAARGALAALLVAWLALWVDVLRVAGVAPGLPPLGASRAAELTGSAVEAGALAALGSDPAGRALARMAARPGATLVEVEVLLAEPRVLALRDDALFWADVEHGQVERALQRASFAAAERDAELRRRLRALGVVGDEAEGDPAAFRDAMAEVLRDLGPRLRALRDDPELRRLLRDPEVVAMAQSGDHLGLVAHPGFRGAVARAMAAGWAPAPD